MISKKLAGAGHDVCSYITCVGFSVTFDHFTAFWALFLLVWRLCLVQGGQIPSW
jgi:hypothetical protein